MADEISKSLENEMTIRKLLKDRTDDVAEIALTARAAVLKTATQTSETVYATYCISDSFSFTGKLGQSFIHIATYANHVNLGFNRGAELDDPSEVLKGTGKLIRHVRLDSLTRLRSKPVKKLIADATAQGREMADKKGDAQPRAFEVKDSRKPKKK